MTNMKRLCHDDHISFYILFLNELIFVQCILLDIKKVDLGVAESPLVVHLLD